MASTRVYGLNNCDTCRKARKWLDAHHVAFDFIDYRAEPVDATTLQGWASAVGGWAKLVNRASTTWRALPEADKTPASDTDWLVLVLAHPTLVKRPVLVTADGQTRVGFSETAYAQHFA